MQLHRFSTPYPHVLEVSLLCPATINSTITVTGNIFVMSKVTCSCSHTLWPLLCTPCKETNTTKQPNNKNYAFNVKGITKQSAVFDLT